MKKEEKNTEKKTYYKGFNKDMTCRDFQYREGETYSIDNAILCEKGFHACEYPLDCFNYYNPGTSVFHEVYLEDISDEKGDDSKVVAKKITIGKVLSIPEMVQASIDQIKSKSDSKHNIVSDTGHMSAATNTGDRSAVTNTGNSSAATNTGHSSAATNTGNWSAATNTGNWSAATNTGDGSAATNTGHRSAATNTGNWSAATNTGNSSAATNTGKWSAATNTGNWSAATNTGHMSAATNTGHMSAATNTGDRSAATNTGDWSAAEVSGKESIAIVTGKESKARGALGCWLVLTERDDDYNIIYGEMVKVDGDRVKENVWYMLINGKVTEVE